MNSQPTIQNSLNTTVLYKPESSFKMHIFREFVKDRENSQEIKILKASQMLEIPPNVFKSGTQIKNVSFLFGESRNTTCKSHTNRLATNLLQDLTSLRHGITLQRICKLFGILGNIFCTETTVSTCLHVVLNIIFNKLPELCLGFVFFPQLNIDSV